MNFQAELMDHNARNYAILARLMGRKLSPEQLGLMARLRALMLRPAPAQFSDATEAQHEAAQQLAGIMVPERQMMALLHAPLMSEAVA